MFISALFDFHHNLILRFCGFYDEKVLYFPWVLMGKKKGKEKKDLSA